MDFFADEKELTNCYMRISTTSGIFDLKLQGHTYGYLLASAKKGLLDNIHGFCALVFMVADGIYQDVGFANDITKAVMKYQKRLMIKQAGDKAKAVTDAHEQASQAFMEDVVAEVKMTDKERKAKRAVDRLILKEMLLDDKDKEEV